MVNLSLYIGFNNGDVTIVNMEIDKQNIVSVKIRDCK
jgi:hypothetical protein